MICKPQHSKLPAAATDIKYIQDNCMESGIKIRTPLFQCYERFNKINKIMNSLYGSCESHTVNSFQ